MKSIKLRIFSMHCLRHQYFANSSLSSLLCIKNGCEEITKIRKLIKLLTSYYNVFSFLGKSHMALSLPPARVCAKCFKAILK